MNEKLNFERFVQLNLTHPTTEIEHKCSDSLLLLCFFHDTSGLLAYVRIKVRDQ